MKQAILLVAALAACGGQSDDGFEYDVPEQEQEQEQISDDEIDDKAASQFGYAYEAVENSHGVQNVACANRQNRHCMYPDTKTRKFCVTGTGMTAGQKTEAEADVDAILPAFATQFGGTGWSFSRSCSNTPEVLIEYGNISAAQIKSSILGYVSVMPQSGSLTQVFPGGASGAHWQQKTSGQWVVRVDRPQIITDFDTTNREQRVRRHALYGGMYAAGAGLGFISAHTNRVTSIVITQDSAKLTDVSTSEKCRVDGFTPTDPGAWIQTFGC